ncbi:MAG: hypothetical protein ABJA78_17145 [Ferruginibacter sp.]
MKKIICFFAITSCLGVTAQDTPVSTVPTDSFYILVHKDPRLELLAKKEAEVNATKDYGPRAAKGYRLMILSTTDRQQAINVRSTLLQRFPDQKIYMSFQPPYVKLKFGNFLEKTDADRYKDNIIKAGIVKTSVYLVPEIIEVKPDKNRDSTDN